MRVLSSLLFALVLAAAGAGLACVEEPPSTSSATVHAHDADTVPVCTPLLLAVQRDRTGSASRTATPDVTREHLVSFIELVQTCGGELAVGDICGQSFVPLTRLHIDQSPAAPVEPAFSQNPYVQLQQVAAFQPLKRAYDQALDTRDGQLEADLSTFINAAWPRLAAAPICKASDVAGAVERGLLFLKEPVTEWSVEPRKVIILVSDSQHNVGPWKVSLPDDVEVLLVNGAGSRGAFAGDPRPRLFESIAAVVRFLRLS
jgi:hypothetical protein